MDLKKHFKLYKAGKQWCVAAIATLAMATGVMVSSAQSVHADQQVSTPTTQTVQGSQSLKSDQVKPATPNSTEMTKPADNGNYGWVDSTQVNNNNLTVSGWQATNQAVDKPYRYVIAVDQTTGKELGRTQVMINQQRDDVAKVYPQVANADQSGYQATLRKLNWGNVNDVNDQLKVISRYSNAKNGEGKYVDYVAQRPIQLDKNNYAYLDNFSVGNNQINIAGWNATNQALGKDYHYVILYDQTAGRELGRKRVGNARSDVAKVYPQVINAQNSGFNTNFSLANVDLNHDLRVILRYSNAQNGEGQHVDYWFNVKNFSPVNKSNQGYLDHFDISNGGKVTVSGWHATSYSSIEPNHFLILYDNTNKTQVAGAKANSQVRPDVARIYTNVQNAGNSGFSYTFDNVHLTPGHNYSLVSRYSTSDQGNGDNNGSKYTDVWLNGATLNEAHYYVDSLTTNNNGLHVSGWMVSDNAIGRNNAYVILLDNGKEVNRAKVNLTQRSDVAKVYPHVFNSLNSGFSVDIPANLVSLSGKLQLIFRFAGDPAGNSNYTDQYSQNYVTNAGSFDSVNVNGNTVKVSGWHAAMQSAERPYEYLIVLDNANHEIGRQLISKKNLNRADVQHAYPWISGSAQSGFQVDVPVNTSVMHKVVKLIHRFAASADGNSNYVDYAQRVSIYSGRQTTGNKTITYDDNGNIVAVFNNAEVISQLPELPTGCEITAVTMMLRYAGYNVNKIQLANEMPRSNNGDYGFVGNPFSYSGWWIFPTGIAPVVRYYVGHADIMTGASLQTIKNHLINGHLVVVWVANVNGFVNHALALTGFDSNNLFYNNPWTGRKESMSIGTFYQHWNADRQRAISY